MLLLLGARKKVYLFVPTDSESIFIKEVKKYKNVSIRENNYGDNMFYNYKVTDNVLYLFVDDKCEIGNFFSNGKSDLLSKVKDYIKRMKINFNGTKVVLLLSGLMLGTVYLNKNLDTNYDVYKGSKYVYNITGQSVKKETQEDIEEIINKVVDDAASNINNNEAQNNNIVQKDKDDKLDIKVNNQNNKVSNSNVTEVLPDKVITLKRTNGEVININLEEYLIGVVAAEMPASFNTEALKAQAVVARTYTLKLLESKRTITDDVSTQVYKSNDELKNIWGSDYNKYFEKVKRAVEQTKGLCIKYNGSLIEAIYHSTSNGYTADAVSVWKNEVPYLKSVTSLGILRYLHI